MTSTQDDVDGRTPVTDDTVPTGPPPGAERAEPARWRRVATGIRTSLRAAWPALAGYTLVRVVGVVTLYIWAAARGRGLIATLGRWDGGWYAQVVEHGYDHVERLKSNLEFFPLYPGLTWALHEVVPLSVPAAGVAVAWVAGLAAAWGLYAVGDLVGGRRVGIFLAVVWGVIPHAVVESMAYTEGLFTACCAWSLYALLRRRWVAAGLFCVLAGLTRPTATALILPVALTALIAIIRRRDGWRPWVTLVLAPLGWLGFVLWAGHRVGRIDGWFRVYTQGWGNAFDGGGYTLDHARATMTREATLDYLAVTLILLVAVALLVVGILDRQPWQILLFSAVLLTTSIGVAAYYQSKARFLIPAFGLLLPGAMRLARTWTVRSCVVLAVLTAVSAYFGGYLLLVWIGSP